MVEVLVPRVRLQRVLEGVDHVGQCVQAHHVGGTEGGGLGAADLGAGQVIDHIEGQAEAFGVVERHGHAGGADAVGDEVGRVVGAQHALAQGAGEKGFEVVEDGRGRGGDADDLDQVHVARRVEEMHAAEARLQLRRQGFGQAMDGDARGIGGEDGVLTHMRGDLAVEVVLPLDALGDGLDDEVAFRQADEVVVVVGRFDEVGQLRHAQGCGILLLQCLDGLQCNAVFRTFLCREVEQDGRDFRIDQVRRNLRAHHSGA